MRLHVIYDASCPFCSRLIALAGALDVRQVLSLHDASRPEALAGRFPQLRAADLEGAMHVVEETGRVHRGFFAVRRLAWSSPFTWPLLLVLYLPGAGRLGPRIYGWVARNRRSLGCRFGGRPPSPRGGETRGDGPGS